MYSSELHGEGKGADVGLTSCAVCLGDYEDEDQLVSGCEHFRERMNGRETALAAGLLPRHTIPTAIRPPCQLHAPRPPITTDDSALRPTSQLPLGLYRAVAQENQHLSALPARCPSELGDARTPCSHGTRSYTAVMSSFRGGSSCSLPCAFYR